MPRIKKNEKDEKKVETLKKPVRRGRPRKIKPIEEITSIDAEILEKDYLTDLELSRITINAEKHEVYKRIREISELKRMVLQLRKELYESRIETVERELMLLDKICADQAKDYDNFKYKSRLDLEEIGKAHGIQVGEKFGYNPENGEIIT